MKVWYWSALLALLAACTQTTGSGAQQVYGEIKTGVETSHTRTTP